MHENHPTSEYSGIQNSSYYQFTPLKTNIGHTTQTWISRKMSFLFQGSDFQIKHVGFGWADLSFRHPNTSQRSLCVVQDQTFHAARTALGWRLGIVWLERVFHKTAGCMVEVASIFEPFQNEFANFKVYSSKNPGSELLKFKRDGFLGLEKHIKA